MENTERKKFEQAWQDALAGAEQTPSDKVWMEVDKGLAVAEGGVMKQKVVFYQRLAAASILFALSLGAVTAYYWSNEAESLKPIAEENTIRIEEQAKAETDVNTKSHDLIQGGNTSDETIQNPLLKNSSESGSSGSYLALGSDEEEKKELAPGESTNLIQKKNTREFDYTYTSLSAIDPLQVEVQGKPREVTIVRKLPAMPAYMMADSKRDKKSNEEEHFWAAVGAAAGNYNPQVSTSQSGLLMSPGNSSTGRGGSNMNSQGDAYSMGFQVGTRLAERWVVQGGFAYMNQSIGYTSTMMAVNQSNQFFASMADYSNKSATNASYSATNPYELNSVSEYVSLPIQAGYLIVNRKAGVQINSGLSTDIFLRNTLTDKSGQLESYSEGAGENSPYRTVSWSALLGTELSYKLGSQYRLALVPGMRYSLNPVTKSGDVINPLVWDLGFRFKYIFK